MGKKKRKNKTIWKIWAKSLGEKGSDSDKESDFIAIVRSFIFLTYLVTNIAIVANAVRHWNDGILDTTDDTILMDRDNFPEPTFTRDELTFLQELLNQERSDIFNYYEDLKLQGQDEEADIIHRQYELTKVLRDKIYHMTGRDTLAPGNHDQRWWDQSHGY